MEVAYADGLANKRWPKGKAFEAAARQLSAQFDAPGSALESATASPPQQARLRELTRALIKA